MITERQANLEMGYSIGKRTYSPPNTVYIAMSSTPINFDGSGATEPASVSGYTRVAMPNDSATFSVPSGGVVSNLKKIEFPEVIIDCGTMTHVAVFDSVTGGNIMYYEAFPIPRSLQAFSSLYIDVGGLKFNLNNLSA